MRAPKVDPAATTELTVASGTPVNGWIGGSGFKYWKYEIQEGDPQSYSEWKTALDADPSPYSVLEEGIRHELWEANTDSSKYASVFKGYFYAPVSGDYLFSGFGDDSFGLYMSDDANTSSLNPTPIIYSNSAMSNFDNLYIINRTSAMGATKTLVEGTYYYMEMYYSNNGGGRGDVKVRVEVPNTDATLKWQRYEINHIETSFTNDPEEIEFTLTNIDATVGNTFSLTLTVVDSATLKSTTQIANFTLTDSLNTFSAMLKNIDIFNYGPYGLSLTALDASGNPVAASHASVTSITWKIAFWNIRPAAKISLTSSVKFKAVTTNTNAALAVSITHPHGPIISGTFGLQMDGVDITINDASGVSTSMLPFDISGWTLGKAIESILNSPSPISVTRRGDPSYGCRWIIDYSPLNLDIPDIVLNPSGLSGGLAGTSPTGVAEEDQKYSTNLVFNPVSYQFLYMPAASLSVQVKTNGIMAECTGDCSYAFETNTPEVTANTLTGSSVAVTMSDPQTWNYPTSDLEVTVDGQVCSISSGTFATFTCNLPTNSDSSPVLKAGSHFVKVNVRDLGQVPIQTGVASMDYDLVLAQATPSTGQTNGGYQVVLEGNGFPSDASLVSVTICSGLKAQVVSITNTEVTVTVPSCPTAALDAFSLTYDGQTLTTDYTYTSASTSSSLISVSPSSASPVQKAIMTITGTGFGTDSSVVDVRLADYENSKFYPMRILTITDTEIQCGIPGGLPGSYQVEVTVDGLGNVPPASSTADDFVYEIVIENISPSSGPYNGGTLLTITGRNFSPNEGENLIFVGDGLNWFCNLVSFTPSEITCRMPEYNPTWTTSALGIHMSQKLIQDAVCEGSCTFTYGDLSASPSLSTISQTTSTSGVGAVTLTGANFNLVASSDVTVVIENTLSGVITQLTPTSVTPSSIIFDVPTSPSGVYKVRARLGAVG